MKGLRRNIAENKLGVTFCLLILIYMLILYLEVAGLRLQVAIFPLIFLTLTSVCAILKIMLDLTNSTYLQRLDGISFFKMETKKPPSDPSYEKIKLKREIVCVISLAILFGMVYLIGFLPSAFIFGFLFTYQSYKKFKKPILISLLLTLVTYLFSLVLPGELWRGILLGA